MMIIVVRAIVLLYAFLYILLASKIVPLFKSPWVVLMHLIALVLVALTDNFSLLILLILIATGLSLNSTNNIRVKQSAIAKNRVDLKSIEKLDYVRELDSDSDSDSEPEFLFTSNGIVEGFEYARPDNFTYL